MSTLSVKVISDVTSLGYVDSSLAAANSASASAFNQANVAFSTANSAFNAANNVNLGPAFNQANLAYANANTRLSNTDITITGNVTTTQVFNDSKGEMRNIPLNIQSSTYTLVLSGGGTNNTAAQVSVTTAATGQVSSITVLSGGSYTGTPTANVFGNTVFTFTMGGRNGRTTYETLVAMGSMEGDASDDAIAPDS